MGITGKLKIQLESEDEIVRQDAKDCLTIANKLKELENGCIWSTQWQVLTTVVWVGKVGNYRQHWYKPSKIGEIFIKGLNN